MKILVAMSGGVDSSVAAAMLVAEGHDVTGVHLKLSEASPESNGRVHGCCTVEAADDARRVADVLDIPFYVWNLKDTFSSAVIDDFVREYERGRTPNPCVRCNETVKFGALLDRGRATGFDAVATGHYAINREEDGRRRLYRSADRTKDQSYVLATLGRQELAFARFPVGAQTKDRTREIARSLMLRTADKPESYDICFVPDGDAAAFVERAGATVAPGPILDPDGNEVGEHGGIHRFTVGQRRGLGLATAERRFVLEVDASRNAIVVGPGELLARGGLTAEKVSWVGGEPPVTADCTVQVRAHGEPVPATITSVEAGRVAVRFGRPQRGIAPGQLAALYDGDEVLGAGTIDAALPL
ncbi:MAG: tRNA 2-thiouridine(34) synthase MnmA [Actinomycetota bacterium]|nr:tRNA 2-thiouridine(34) synthase MnmA [Actinomycetota bacterium]